MSELYHHGVKGMKWGRRRYQNPDGTLTPAGKKRRRLDSSYQRSDGTLTLKGQLYRKELEDMANLDVKSQAFRAAGFTASGLGAMSIGTLMRKSDKQIVAETGRLLQLFGGGFVAGTGVTFLVEAGQKYIAQKELLKFPDDTETDI